MGNLKTRLLIISGLVVVSLALVGGTVLAHGNGKKSDVENNHEQTENCKPGWGYGDKNHCHSGPPGLSVQPSVHPDNESGDD